MRRPYMRFRRLLGAALIVLAAANLLAISPTLGQQTPKKDDQFQTSAPFAILIDADSGTLLFDKNADQLMEPESMAKLMTDEVVFNELKQGKLKPDEEFVVSENAWRRGGAPSHTSTMYAPINSRTRVIDLLHGAII